MERTSVSPAMRVFLSQLIDYAGLFPPAKLPMADAVDTYARHRGGEHAWMLSTFICPAARFTELEPTTAFFAKRPVPLAALGRSGDTADAFLSGFEADLAAIDAFVASHGDAVDVQAIETRLPADPVDDPAKLSGLLGEVRERLAAGGHETKRLFVEIPMTEEWTEWVANTTNVLGGENLDRADHSLPPIGLKVRCGGVTADAFPSPEQVAFAIAAARNQRVPIKFTAGLHHPFRHHDDAIGTMMHGFMNVFVSACAAYSHGLTVDRIRKILNDESPANFVVDEEAISWKGYRLTREEIESARSFAISYGSCSFDEPVEDLTELGYL